jgi:hypothetical protein
MTGRFLYVVLLWKGRSCPCAFIKYHATKTYGGVDALTPYILKLGHCWRRAVSFTPRCHTPGEYMRWIGGWVGPSASLDAVEKKKKSRAFVRNRTQIPPSSRPSPSHGRRHGWPSQAFPLLCFFVGGESKLERRKLPNINIKEIKFVSDRLSRIR